MLALSSEDVGVLVRGSGDFGGQRVVVVQAVS